MQWKEDTKKEGGHNMNAKLLKIQSELKAPKNQRNDFGKYNYRSCEDILEAVKPLCLRYNCTLTISDDIIEVGGRIYVKSTAAIMDNEKGQSVTASAFAREADVQKGMSEPQITGSASSYARKYALNGLFCIDDTKDADATNKHEEKNTEKAKTKGNLQEALKAIGGAKSEAEILKYENLIKAREWTKEEEQQLSVFIQSMRSRVA
jgi:hypothetical protein